MYQQELGRWKNLVERSMLQTCRSERVKALKVDGRMSFIIDRIQEYALRGSSKRLRAFLVLVGYQATGGRPPAALVDVAAAIEFLHAYLLMHDDVIDRDEQRRGGSTMHVQFARKVRSTHLGEGLAVLAGNITSVLAHQSIANSALTAKEKHLASTEIRELNLQTNYGEALDVWLGSEDTVSVPEVEKVYLYKTAKYSVEGPLVLGARLAGANAQQLRRLSQFALPVGIAFQLQDDLLGIYGNAKDIGKPVGSDIREGKRTTLFLHATRLSRPRDKMTLKRFYGRGRVTRQGIDEVRRIFTRSGARAHVEQQITQLTEEASRILRNDQLIQPRSKRTLQELNTALAKRRS